MNGDEVNKAEWQQWKKDKVTKLFVAGILNKREYLKEGLVEGHLSTHDEQLMAMGKCQAIKDIVTYLIEDFNYIERDQEEISSDGT